MRFQRCRRRSTPPARQRHIRGRLQGHSRFRSPVKDPVNHGEGGVLEHRVCLGKERLHGFEGVHLVVLVDEVDDALGFFVADVGIIVANFLEVVAADIMRFTDRGGVMPIRARLVSCLRRGNDQRLTLSSIHSSHSRNGPSWG